MAEHDIALRATDLGTVALPDVCVRHGLAATAHAELALTARKKRQGEPLIVDTNVVGMAARATDQLAQQAVRRDGWPLCPRCASRRATSITAAKALALLGVLLIVAAVVVRLAAGQSGVAGALLGLGIVAFPAALWVGLRSRVATIANATLSQDRRTVTIHEPSEAFARQWRERNA